MPSFGRELHGKFIFIILRSIYFPQSKSNDGGDSPTIGVKRRV